MTEVMHSAASLDGPAPSMGGAADARLPLVTFYLTDRCNSRCVTCDYWRHGRLDVSLQSIAALLPDLRKLHTRVALLSGGEPLMNPEWRAIAALLRDAGLRVWLLTAGLALAKHAADAAALCETITVSLDGTQADTYRAIRGLDAFDKVCEGIRAVVSRGASVGLRVTLQRANYPELERFVGLAHELGVHQVSFLAVDVANAHAFARENVNAGDLPLAPADLPRFAAGIDALERYHAQDFHSGFIAESPQKLRRIHQYFAAIHGLADFPAVRCNAPEFSAVVGADARVSPCFFIPGTGVDTRAGLINALGEPSMVAQRARIRDGEHAECARCVCSMWRDPRRLAETGFGLKERAHA